MTPAQRMELLYFVQSRVGRREAFAESFATALQQPTPAFKDRFFVGFPRSIVRVQDIIRQLTEAGQ